MTKLEVGDLLLFKPKGVIKDIFQIANDNYWHVAIFYGDIDGVDFIIESIYDGVSLTPLNSYYAEDYDVYRLVKEPPKNLREKMVKFVGIRYDYWGLLGAILVELMRLLKLKIPNFLNQKQLLLCVELAAMVHELPEANSPQDLLANNMRRINYE